MRCRLCVLPSVVAAGWAFVGNGVQAADFSGDSRWGLRAQFGFNIKADFTDVRPIVSAVPPQAGTGIDRNYADGYVRVDSNGNAGGTTWNWGYQNASQYDNTGAGAIVMHAASGVSGSDIRGATGSQPQLGWELSYGKDFGILGHSWWGLEAALGVLDLDLSSKASVRGTATSIADSFGLGGVIPPLASYNGTFNGPGPLLDEAPGSRTTSQVASLTAGTRDLQSLVVSLRLGPYLHYPINNQWSLSLAAGPALAFLSSDFKFNERTTAGGSTLLNRTGSVSDSAFSFGGYVDGRIHYQFRDKRWGLFGGAQYRYLQNTDLTAAGKRATLRMGAGIWTEFGVSYTY